MNFNQIILSFVLGNCKAVSYAKVQEKTKLPTQYSGLKVDNLDETIKRKILQSISNMR